MGAGEVIAIDDYPHRLEISQENGSQGHRLHRYPCRRGLAGDDWRDGARRGDRCRGDGVPWVRTRQYLRRGKAKGRHGV
jgi:hypothetical protein